MTDNCALSDGQHTMRLAARKPLQSRSLPLGLVLLFAAAAHRLMSVYMIDWRGHGPCMQTPPL